MFGLVLLFSKKTPENYCIFTEQASFRKGSIGTFLVARLRIRVPMQGTRVWALVREDPTCRGATKPVCHNYWAYVPQLQKPTHLEPVLRNKRSHLGEKPAHRNEEKPPLDAARESPCTATKTQRSQKINKQINKFLLKKKRNHYGWPLLENWLRSPWRVSFGE